MSDTQLEAPTYATPTEVAVWVGLAPATPPDEEPPAIVTVTATANYTIGRLIGSAEVPESVAQHAALALAADLYEQRNAPAGIRMFMDAAGGAAPMRVRADAAGRARAILSPYLPPAFA